MGDRRGLSVTVFVSSDSCCFNRETQLVSNKSLLKVCLVGCPSHGGHATVPTAVAPVQKGQAGRPRPPASPDGVLGGSDNGQEIDTLVNILFPFND